MESDQATTAAMERLTGHLAFQQRWRNITMACHVLTTIVVIVCSTGATLISAWNKDLFAAVLAGIATVLVALDRSLRFREKWKLHVAVLMSLERTKLALATGRIDATSAVDQINATIAQYADNLPFGET